MSGTALHGRRGKSPCAPERGSRPRGGFARRFRQESRERIDAANSGISTSCRRPGCAASRCGAARSVPNPDFLAAWRSGCEFFGLPDESGGTGADASSRLRRSSSQGNPPAFPNLSQTPISLQSSDSFACSSGFRTDSACRRATRALISGFPRRPCSAAIN